MCSFIEPKSAHAILKAIFAILVVLLAADDVGKMHVFYGEQNVGLDALGVGIGVLRHVGKDERLMREEEKEGKGGWKASIYTLVKTMTHCQCAHSKADS
jgi:hypothetical protein